VKSECIINVQIVVHAALFFIIMAATPHRLSPDRKAVKMTAMKQLHGRDRHRRGAQRSGCGPGPGRAERQKRPLEVVVVDAKDPRGFATNSFDGRASAITAAARRMFEALGVWQQVSHEAQPMTDIIVTDSATPGAARPVLLQFGPEDMRGGPSSHMIENRHLYGAMLAEAQESPHIRFVVGQPVERYHFGPGLAAVTLADGTTLRAPLIVAADGRNSPAREAAGIRLVGWPYDQMGLVATVEHDCRTMAGRKSISRPRGLSPSCRCPATAHPSSGRSARRRRSACSPCRWTPSRTNSSSALERIWAR
jgi:hypothetical protein